MLTVNDILGNGGLAAKRLNRYEERTEQLEMAAAVADAIERREHLAVEAGTGVGKSFAYLVPAILYLAEWENRDSQNDDAPDTTRSAIDWSRPVEELLAEAALPAPTPEKRRVVVSTHTISLQEQLFDKDIPFLHSILPFEFTSVLIKGRSNYLCRRRLRAAVKRSASLFDNREHDELVRLSEWSRQTADGSLSDLENSPMREVWSEIACEQGNCLGRGCPDYADCFYQRARRRAENASLLIVNHALLFSDLAIRRQGGAILPNYDVLVFDEAHTMEQAASEHLGISLSQGTIDYLLSRLYSERTGKGLLQDKKFESARAAVDLCRLKAEELFFDLDGWLTLHSGGNGRVLKPNIAPGALSVALRKLAVQLHEAADLIPEPENRVEYVAARMKTIALAGLLDVWLGQTDADYVYWLERSTTRRTVKVSMEAAPLSVGSILREHLFSKVPAVIMTSATLATEARRDGGDGFTFFRSRIGLPDLNAVQLGSPFDYRRQATLVLVDGLPDPAEKEQENSSLFTDKIKQYIKETDGGAFVLFTSYALLKKTADSLLSWLAKEKYPFFSQADSLPRSKMIERFRRSKRGVLFGTDSFWQGVDVPGPALRNVIITRLPFPVPSQPLTEARLEAIALTGENPFSEYSIPLAILKLKQGFGRLIRSKDDQGMAVILDPRIKTRTYGRRFLMALPDCRIRIDLLQSNGNDKRT